MHIGGAIQALVMPVVGSRADGRPRYQPVTTQSWEDILWKNYGCDHPGLTWELESRSKTPGGASGSRSPGNLNCQEILLRRLDRFIAEIDDDSAVLALDYHDVDSTYEKLKA